MASYDSFSWKIWSLYGHTIWRSQGHVMLNIEGGVICKWQNSLHRRWYSVQLTTRQHAAAFYIGVEGPVKCSCDSKPAVQLILRHRWCRSRSGDVHSIRRRAIDPSCRSSFATITGHHCPGHCDLYKVLDWIRGWKPSDIFCQGVKNSTTTFKEQC